MSLQVWLPLDGNLTQQGLNEVTATANGAVIDNTGKIGKCYSFNGSNSISLPSVVLPSATPEWSFSCWFYLANTTSSTAACLFSERGGGGTPNGYTIFLYPNNSSILVDDGVRWTVTPMTFSATTWYHLVVTRSTAGKKIYINGELKSSTTTVGTTTAINTNGCLIGLAQSSTSLTAGNQGWNGKLNDVRIYDHTLSPKEVKEISKGLVLHYKLNSKKPLNNLKKNNTYGVYNNFGNSGTTGSLTKLNEKYQGCDVYRLTMTPNETSLSSFKTVLHSHGICGFSTTFAASTKYCFWIYYRPVTHNDIRVGGTASNISGWTEIAPKKYTDEWYVVGQYRNGSVTEAKTDQIFTSFYSPSAANGVPISIDFCCPHLVEGTTEIIDDGDYQEVLNRNIEYDCSGYGHNGDIIETLTNTINSPRYDRCIHFSATNQKIHISGLTTTGFGDSYTFTWWGKCASWSNKMHWGFSDGVRLNGIYNGNLWNTGDGSNNPLYNIGTTTQVTVPDNNWHFWAMTSNGTKCYVYKDGILWAEAKTYKSISGTSIYINGWGSNADYSNTDLDMCDYRIYATALSAEDILELYHTSASIDNQGNVYVYEVME